MATNEDCPGWADKNIKQLTWVQKLDEAYAEYHSVMVRMSAVTRAGGEGTSLEKNLQQLEKYIDWLEKKVALKKLNWLQFQFQKFEGIPWGSGLPNTLDNE